jgi:uncharacterized repeat protein (TIGR04138 family)
MQRLIKQKGFDFASGKPSKEQMQDHLQLLNDVAERMARWVAERGPDESSELDAGPDTPFALDSVFEQFAGADSRFQMEAYRFVARAVRKAIADGTAKTARHVTGREVALAFRLLALKEFGRKALATLIDWGIYTTDDIGTLVFQMVEAGILGVRPEDKLVDFHAVYDFAAAFPQD